MALRVAQRATTLRELLVEWRLRGDQTGGLLDKTNTAMLAAAKPVAQPTSKTITPLKFGDELYKQKCISTFAT